MKIIIGITPPPGDEAQDDIEAAFPPGSFIEAFTYPTPMPENYDAEALPSLTIVYGTGEEYLETVPGRGRRRLGSGGAMPRDYTVFVSRLVVVLFVVPSSLITFHLFSSNKTLSLPIQSSSSIRLSITT